MVNAAIQLKRRKSKAIIRLILIDKRYYLSGTDILVDSK